MLSKHKKIITLAALNILIILSAFAWFLCAHRNLKPVGYTLSDIANWKVSYAAFDGASLYVDESYVDSGTPINLIWGPYGELPKGSYSVSVNFEADASQKVYATAAGEEHHLVTSSEGILNWHADHVVYQFECSENLNRFQLIIRYSGYGNFRVNSISITPNNNRNKRILTEVLAALLILDACFAVSALPLQKRRVVLALAGIALLISLPLAFRGHQDSDDLEVHYLRIEAIVQALRSGQFPARISSICHYGLGYPFSIYYNDIFLYFPALLRLLGFSVNAAYKIYAFSINFLTVLIAYVSFSRIFRSKKSGMVLTLLYTTASYRILNVYERAAVGEYTAQAFLPLAALAVYWMFSAREADYKKIFRNGLILTAAMSGIIGSHILTTILSAFFLGIFCLLKWKTTFRKETFTALVLAVIFTIAVNLYFLVPLLDYHLNVPSLISTDQNNYFIQLRGVSPAQFFAFSQNLNGSSDYFVVGRSQFTPGFPLMIVFVIALGLRLYDPRKKQYDFLLFFSALAMLLSTDVFPWNHLIIHSKFWHTLSTIQFPWRFLSFAVLFETLLAGQLLRDYDFVKVRWALAACAVLMMCWFTGNVMNSGEIRWIYDTSSLQAELTGTMYLLEGTKEYDLIQGYDIGIKANVIEGEHMAALDLLSRNSYSLKMYARADDSHEVHHVIVPIFNYKGYHAVDEDGNEFPLSSGVQNVITFDVPDGFDGTITVAFRDPASWRTALLISAVSVILLAAGYVVWKKRINAFAPAAAR